MVNVAERTGGIAQRKSWRTAACLFNLLQRRWHRLSQLEVGTYVVCRLFPKLTQPTASGWPGHWVRVLGAGGSVLVIGGRLYVYFNLTFSKSGCSFASKRDFLVYVSNSRVYHTSHQCCAFEGYLLTTQCRVYHPYLSVEWIILHFQKSVSFLLFRSVSHSFPEEVWIFSLPSRRIYPLYHSEECITLTIQKSVSLAKPAYSSMVERTLKMRQMSTTMNLDTNIDH